MNYPVPALVGIHFDPSWLDVGPEELKPLPVVGISVTDEGEPDALLVNANERLQFQSDLEMESGVPVRLTTPDTESVTKTLIRIIGHHHQQQQRLAAQRTQQRQRG